jgi:LuxR family maltose regulon positive regulatory protein
MIIIIMATMGLGSIQENENQLPLAAETYQRALQLAGNPPLAAACEAYIGLARIFYQWNDLDRAQQYGYQALQLARQIQNSDRFISCEVFLARLKLAQRDLASATALLSQAEQTARERQFVYQIPDIAAAQVLTLIDKGDLSAAAHLAQTHELPLSLARVHMAQGDPSRALAVLEPFRKQLEAKNWQDERLKVMALQAVAHHVRGEKHEALNALGDTLALAAPSGFIRLFVDEGPLMAQLLTEAAAHGMMPDYVGTLLAAFDTGEHKSEDKAWPSAASSQGLIEPLSERELEILQLVAQGLSNHEISEQLFLALSTVKGHNRNIFDKLQVQRRTEAVARARELGLI